MRWVREGSESYSTALSQPSRYHELDWCYNARNYPMDVERCGRCVGDDCPGVKVHHIAKLLKWLDMSAWQIHSWRGEAPAHPWWCLCNTINLHYYYWCRATRFVWSSCAWPVGYITLGRNCGSRALSKRATASFAPVSLKPTIVATGFRRNVSDDSQVSSQTPQRRHLKAARCIVGPASASSTAIVISHYSNLVQLVSDRHRNAVTVRSLTLAVATMAAPLGIREAARPSRGHSLAVGTPVDPGNPPRPAALAAPRLPPSAAARTDCPPPTALPAQRTANHAPAPLTGCQRAREMPRDAFSAREAARNAHNPAAPLELGG